MPLRFTLGVLLLALVLAGAALILDRWWEAAPPSAPPVTAVPAPSGPAPSGSPGGLILTERPARPEEVVTDDRALTQRPPPRWLKGSSRNLGPTQKDRSTLGPLRPFVASGLGQLQGSVARCADEGPPPDAAPLQHGRIALRLELVPEPDGFRIAEVAPDDPAVASDWRVACAQRKLRGQLIHAPVNSKTEPATIPFDLDL